MMAITFPFLEGSKVFYLNSEYTFLTLKETLELELQQPVEVEGTGLNTNIFKYLLSNKSEAQVKVIADEVQFSLTPAYKFREAKIMAQASSIAKSPVPIYKNMIEHQVDPSHSNTLAWLLNQLNLQNNMTVTEITEQFRKALDVLKSPAKDQLYDLQHKINIIESELIKLQASLDTMNETAQKSGYRWLTLIFILSVIQIAGFYYGIYQIEDWGWNTCEPWTYSFQCVSVALGMVFYIRYRQQREIETIRNAFFMKRQGQRRWRERWENLNSIIALKQEQKHKLELQRIIRQNRTNYHYYVQFNKLHNLK